MWLAGGVADLFPQDISSVSPPRFNPNNPTHRENMVREISLLVYHSQLFPAHWGLWIPSAGNPTVGKVIHVTGDSFTGFGHELKRGYSTVNTDRKPGLFFLANVEDRHIVDTPVCGVDTIAVDDIERIALATPAPAKSLNRASGEVGLLSRFGPALFTDFIVFRVGAENEG